MSIYYYLILNDEKIVVGYNVNDPEVYFNAYRSELPLIILSSKSIFDFSHFEFTELHYKDEYQTVESFGNTIYKINKMIEDAITQEKDIIIRDSLNQYNKTFITWQEIKMLKSNLIIGIKNGTC